MCVFDDLRRPMPSTATQIHRTLAPASSTPLIMLHCPVCTWKSFKFLHLAPVVHPSEMGFPPKNFSSS